MEKVRQKLSAVRIHWPRLLIACLVLALSFGAGMGVRTALERAEKENEIQAALSNFNRQMRIFSNDVKRITREAQQAEAAGEIADDPAENYAVSSGLAFLREKAVAIADMAELPQSRQYSNAKVYLASWKPALLGAGCADAEALSEIVTISRPLWDAVAESCEDTMARLEENILSGDYQDALDLLGMGDSISTTTQGGA